jgi:drug/metabolite transporter (DMT)-like permease
MWQLLRRLWLPLLADTGVGSVAFTYGITHTDLALGATLSSLSPLVALPIAAALGSERVTLGKIVAVSITVGGVVLLVAASG